MHACSHYSLPRACAWNVLCTLHFLGHTWAVMIGARYITSAWLILHCGHCTPSFISIYITVLMAGHGVKYHSSLSSRKASYFGVMIATVTKKIC